MQISCYYLAQLNHVPSFSCYVSSFCMFCFYFFIFWHYFLLPAFITDISPFPEAICYLRLIHVFTFYNSLNVLCSFKSDNFSDKSQFNEK